MTEEAKKGSSPEEIKARLTEGLRSVVDPEIGLSVVDLGLIYGIDLDGKSCRIRMTLTSQACPVGPQMMAGVQRAAQTVTGLDDVKVELVWKPPWDPRIHASEDGKFMLGIV